MVRLHETGFYLALSKELGALGRGLHLDRCKPHSSVAVQAVQPMQAIFDQQIHASLSLASV